MSANMPPEVRDEPRTGPRENCPNLDQIRET
jgi:hypothetical protein